MNSDLVANRFNQVAAPPQQRHQPQPINLIQQQRFDKTYMEWQEALLQHSPHKLPRLLEETDELANNVVFPSLIRAAFTIDTKMMTTTAATPTTVTRGGNGFQYPTTSHPLYGPRRTILYDLLEGRAGVAEATRQQRDPRISRGYPRTHASPYPLPGVYNNSPTEKVWNVSGGQPPQHQHVNLITASMTPSMNEEAQTLTDTEREMSIQTPSNNAVDPIHYGPMRQQNPNNVGETMIFNTAMSFKYHIDLINNIEIRVVSVPGTEAGTGVDNNDTVRVWQVLLEHGPQLSQKFAMRVNPTKRRSFLNLMTKWFKEMCFTDMEKFGCHDLDVGPDQPCVHKPFDPECICKVHFKGGEERRIAEIRRRVELKFSLTILKFVVRRDRVGIVTDPKKLDDDDYTGSNFWFVHKDIVANTLKTLRQMDVDGFFDKH